MIEIKNVYKTFYRNKTATEALKGVSLKVAKGDIFGVIGYSGAGKSTIVRTVNYLEKPTKGDVIIDGQPLDQLNKSELREMKKTIGMIFQHFNLLESKTTFDNVAMPLILSKKSKSEINERVTELLEFVGLSDKADSFPSELSGGQKQRVGIARALALNPKILLCDEATSALDPETTKSILQLLKRINKEYNITILLITHEMSVIQEICNQVAVMENGKIIEQGSVLEVFGHPKQETTKNFVETVIHNQIPNTISKLVDQKNSIYRVEVTEDSVTEPIINELIKHHDVDVNVIFINMTEIQETMLVTMYLQFAGENQAIQNALSYLKSNHARVEEVKEL